MSDIIPQTVLNKTLRDKFVMILDLPKILKGSQTNTVRSNKLVNLDKLQFSVVGTLVPKITVPSEMVPYRGQSLPISTHSRPPYPPIRVSFKVDNNFDNYWVLWKWLSLLNLPRESGTIDHFAEFKKIGDNIADTHLQSSPQLARLTGKQPEHTNLKYEQVLPINPYTDYETTITVLGLREYNEQIVKFEYFNSFITDLGEISYDYKETGEIDCYFEFAFGQLDVSLIDPI